MTGQRPSNQKSIVQLLRETAEGKHPFAGHLCWNAADELDRLAARLAEAEQLAQSLQNKWAARPLSDADLIAENERLRAALERYGAHEGHCQGTSMETICECGLDAALAGGESKDG